MVCCVTGHRPKGFPFPRVRGDERFERYLDKLKYEVGKLITEGYTYLVTGLAEGADLDFAWVGTLYRRKRPEVFIEGVAPYRRAKNPGSFRDKIISECDKVTVLSERYYSGCMQDRNMHMVDKSDIVLAIWNGEEHGGSWNTISYARSQGKKIVYIMLNEL